MIRTMLAAFIALAALSPSAHALTAEELAIARTFEGAWGLSQDSQKDIDEQPGMGCGEPRAITVRIEQDEWQDWRFYTHPDQSFTGVVVVGASDDGTTQRLTVEMFAPIGTNTASFERRGDRLMLGLAWRDQEFKRC